MDRARRFLVVMGLCLAQLACVGKYLVNIQHLGIEQGLSSRIAYCVHQDKKGFIWIGTSYGLNRYDGYNFRWWTSNNSALASNNISDILEDDAGNLWLFDREQYNRYIHVASIQMLQTDTYNITPFPTKAPFEPKAIQQYFSDQEKNLWFFTKQGELWKYRSSTGFVQEKLPVGFSPICTDNGSTWWGLNNDTITKLDRTSRQLPLLHIKEQGVNFAQLTAADDLWMAISGGRFGEKYLYTAHNGRLTDLTPQLREGDVLGEGVFASAYLSEKDGTIWIGADNKLAIFSLNQDSLYFSPEELMPGKKPTILDVFVDKQGLGWIATNMGVFLVELKKNKFRTYNFTPSRLSKIFGCRGLLRSGNQLFVNSQIGRYTIDLSTDSVTESNGISFFSQASQPSYPIHQGYSGNIWIAGNLVATVDAKTGGVHTIYERAVENYQAERAWGVFEDQRQTVWTVLDNELYYFQFNQDSLLRQYQLYNDITIPTYWNVLHFYEDKQGIIWMASTNGLYALDPEKGFIGHYWSDGTSNYYLPTKNIHHLYQDTEGIFWLATAENGLIRWNPKAEKSEERIQQFTQESGLSSNTIYAIYEDGHQQLWMSSLNGLMQFDKKTHQCRKYYPRDGISDIEFNRLAHHQDEEGNLYFGGLTGITIFHPDDFYNGDYEVNLEIASYYKYLGGEDTVVERTTRLWEDGKIVMLPGDRFVTLEFSLQDYFYTDMNSYAYKIEGLHESWNDIRKNSIQLAGLPYGKYTMLVKGKGPDGRFSTQQLAIPMHIWPPFYLRPWFLVSSGIGLVFLAWLFAHLQNRHLSRQRQKLQRTVQERTWQIQQDKQLIEQQAEALKELDAQKSRFFANISHELRTPLTLILGPANKLAKKEQGPSQQRNYGLLIKQNAKTLLQRIDDLLALSRLDANHLNLQEEPAHFHSLLQRAIGTFESYATQQGVNLQLSYEADESLWLLLDSNKIMQILANFLTNAIKFTPPGGRINMLAKENSCFIEISVQDTGTGIGAEDLPYIFDRFYQAKHDGYYQGTGIGLALCKELAQLMEGNVWATSSKGKGSTFYIQFPKKVAIVEQKKFISSTGEEEMLSPLLADEPVQQKQYEHTILIVEDNNALRQFIASELQGYQILCAEHGQQALAVLSEHKIDLIISDIMMPIMDGFQLLETVKKDERWQRIPVIMLTARSSAQDKLSALRIGVDDYLIKPFDTDELQARIHNLLRRFRSRTDAAEQPNESEPISPDQKWLQEVEQFVLAELEQGRLTVDWLADELLLSKRQLQRRIKNTTGMTISEYIREIRLHQARTFLESGDYATVAEVVYAVGLKDSTHFSNLYHQRFGKRPLEYLQS